jgi:tetratricopeptide (TPR) repeat protein
VQVAEAFNEKAFAIDLAPRIKILDELLGYFSEAPETPIRLQVATALSSKAGTLGRMFRIEEQKIVFADFLRRFAEAPEAEIRARVAGALLWRAREPLVKARNEEAVAVLDELLSRISQEREPEIEVFVADAMFERLTALGKMGRQNEQIAACNDVISRFADHQELRVRRVVAKVFLEKVRLLGSFRKTEEEVEVYREFLTGFSGDSEEVIQEFISGALLAMGHAFAALEKPVQAIAALDELVQVQSKLRWGMPPRRLAEILLCKARMLEFASRNDEAGAAYRELLAMGSTVPDSILWLVPIFAGGQGKHLAAWLRGSDFICSHNAGVAR